MNGINIKTSVNVLKPGLGPTGATRGPRSKKGSQVAIM